MSVLAGAAGTIYCYCQRQWVNKKHALIILCTECSTSTKPAWYHRDCVGMSEVRLQAEGVREHSIWCCPRCVRLGSLDVTAHASGRCRPACVSNGDLVAILNWKHGLWLGRLDVGRSPQDKKWMAPENSEFKERVFRLSGSATVDDDAMQGAEAANPELLVWMFKAVGQDDGEAITPETLFKYEKTQGRVQLQKVQLSMIICAVQLDVPEKPRKNWPGFSLPAGEVAAINTRLAGELAEKALREGGGA